jgi:hypothetical protein
MCQKYEKSQIHQWVNEYKESGSSIYEYSKGKPFHASDLFHWLEGNSSKAETKPVAESLPESNFIEVSGMWPASQALITIHYPNGVRVEVNYAMEADHLKNLVK